MADQMSVQTEKTAKVQGPMQPVDNQSEQVPMQPVDNQSEQVPTIEDVLGQLGNVQEDLEAIAAQERNRFLSITLTELDKLVAFIAYHLKKN